jgi:cob(I)alamin adenosyltransferase
MSSVFSPLNSLKEGNLSDLIKNTLEKYQKGLIIVITGDGKGKTTSAIGQAMRAAGHGKKILIVQFMKGKKYGEVLCTEEHIPDISIIQCGLDSFVMKDNPAPVDVELAQQGLKISQEAVASGNYDMLILDEINVAMDFKLVSIQDVLNLIKNKPTGMDIILTGRYAPAEIIEVADTVSEVREIKHHYSQGIKERAGIEF